MALKRMFSVKVTEDDVFLDMPATSQNLYFHLCMNADDDGFVSPRKIMRMCSATIDDLNILVAKRYVLVFPSGVSVVKAWPIMNKVAKDRYIKTTYQKEFEQLTLNEWGVYTERRTIKTPLTELQQDKVLNANIKQNVDTLSPQVRLDQVRLDQVSNNPSVSSAEIDAMMADWKNMVGYEISGMGNRRAVAALLRQHGNVKLRQLMKGVVAALDDKYAPRISDFVSLKRKQNDLLVWGRKRSNESGVTVIR